MASKCFVTHCLTAEPNNHMMISSPFISNTVLVLDVDGVLCLPNQTKYNGCRNISPRKCKCVLYKQCYGWFFIEMKEYLAQICMRTRCDIIISSSWQFQSLRLQYLYQVLCDCGWKYEQIHTLSYLFNNIIGQEFNQCLYDAVPCTYSRYVR